MLHFPPFGAAAPPLLSYTQLVAMQTCLSAKTAPVAVRAAAPRQGSLRPALTQVQNKFAQRTVSNGYKTRQMMVWQPTDNK